jgi:hypothetical protein
LTHRTVDEQQWIQVCFVATRKDFLLTIHYSMQYLLYHNRNM